MSAKDYRRLEWMKKSVDKQVCATNPLVRIRLRSWSEIGGFERCHAKSRTLLIID